MGYTRDEIIDLVIDNDVKFVRLQFTDMFGVFKNVAITVSQLQKALDGLCMFDGSSIEGFVGIEESDMYLIPDLDTFTIFPWRPQHGKVARFICDVYTPDKQPFEGAPRRILQKTLEKANKMGYEFNVGSECEFFLFQTDDSGRPTTIPHDSGTYFDIGPADMGENIRREIALTLEDMDFEIEMTHHENAPGQHEVDFKYSDAMKAADNIMTLKMVVKTIAQRNGLFASFMPKPLNNIDGSGMHANISLSKNGENVFYDPNDERGLGLSKVAYQFMAGVLEHMNGISLITNPIVNSYKRTIAGFEAPVYSAWSVANRSTLLRIPMSSPESKRIELRCPDTACNPYLEFAAILAAGLDGIERGLTPPEPVEGNIYKMSEAERAGTGVEKLPRDLGEAIDMFERSSLMKETLGEQFTEKYLF
ncbi:MAG: type I glutamate--ammonia ligase, partial [Anaerotignaceae bacterium]